MTKIKNIFKPYIAKSYSFTTYEAGTVAFVSNGFANNGVVGYISPKPKDRIFKELSICVSAFCEATVQYPPFIGRGNGGSGLIVLQPIRQMNWQSLIYYASYINKAVKWRFSFGRMVTADRLVNIELPDEPIAIHSKISSLIPKRGKVSPQLNKIELEPVPIESIFTVKSGDYHNAADLPIGNIPLISCGKTDNGLVGYFDIPSKNVYCNTLTVAYNGQPLTTRYHPYSFAAKDDVAVLLPKRPLKATSLLFIQLMLNSETWRYSFGRKCFREKLSNISINLPITGKEFNEGMISELMKNTSYWGFVCTRIRDRQAVVEE